MNDNVTIVEVGARDGLQNEKQIINTQVKFEFIKKLIDAGVSIVEVSSFVRPDKIPQMSDAKELFRLVQAEFGADVRMPCLVPNLKGLEGALEVGVKEVALFTATSNSFNKNNINSTVDESFARLKSVIQNIDRNSIRVRGYLSTVFGCPYEGEMSIDSALDGVNRLFELGVDEISLGDTIGVANPKRVKELISAISKDFDLDKIAMHFHDTEGLALANILTSYECGVRIFDSSAGGLGGCPYAPGATGNVATDDVVNMFHKMDIQTGINQEKLHQASRYILKHLNRPSASKYFNAHEGRKS